MNSKAYKSYEISKNEYRELKYFCLRYGEMSQTIEKNEKNTEKYWNALTSVMIIHDALNSAAENETIRAYLRRSVTENVRFDRLDVPMGRRQFYELRRKFFYILCGLKMGYEVQ